MEPIGQTTPVSFCMGSHKDIKEHHKGISDPAGKVVIGRAPCQQIDLSHAQFKFYFGIAYKPVGLATLSLTASTT